MIRNPRGIFAGLGVIVVAVVVTVTVFSVILNDRCESAFWNNMQVYPGAQQVEKESVFLGVQRVVYSSPDSASAIDAWYNIQRAKQIGAGVQSGDLKSAPPQNWLIEPDAQGNGSLIKLQTTCP
ncbi:MAG: hypothetical protein ABI700_12670 [Chloroflexota bacterium]